VLSHTSGFEALEMASITFIAAFLFNILFLTNPALKHPVFTVVFPTLAILQGILEDANVTFADGLWKTLRSKSPPAIVWFKTLQIAKGKLWGVYLHVLEKDGPFRPKIYIGGGTSIRGVKYRLHEYEVWKHLPWEVQKAFDDGYAITHTGLLCWAPIPSITDKLIIRGLISLLETAFTLYFWAMVSRKSYCMPLLCPWPLDTLEYDGLCTHFSVKEGIYGWTDEPLTPNEVAALDALLKERRREKGAKDRTVRGRERLTADGRRHRDKNKRSKRFHCKPCDTTFTTKAKLDLHYLGKKHLRKVSGFRGKKPKRPDSARRAVRHIAEKKFYCSTCDYAAPQKLNLENHLKSARHLRWVAESSS
jgi:hypothetical protein